MIEVSGLTRYYGTFPAVQDVSFSVEDNSIVGFLGLNGAGKSTVLKMLGGLIPPSAGEIKIAGVDILTASDEFKNWIGYLPEEPPLYREMRVTDFLVWCGEMKGMSRADAEKRLEEVITICQLQAMRNRVIDTLSHGFKKRVGIAQAIIHNPKLVILDEPISGLDPVQIVEMRAVLKNLKGSCTVLLSSHILTEISQICDRILVLNDGKIVADGTEVELNRTFGGQVYYFSLKPREVSEPIETIKNMDEKLGEIQAVELGDDSIMVEVVMEDREPELWVDQFVAAGFGVRSILRGGSELEHIFVSAIESPKQGVEQ